MTLINQILNSIFDILLFPFSGLGQFWGLFFISVLSGVLLVYIFKLTSNQNAIRKIKNRIKSHIFEIRLFDLSPGKLIKILIIILKHNLRYISYSAVPLLFMIIPVLLILIQLNFRYGLRAHIQGDTALLKIHLADNVNIMNLKPDINLNGQAVVDAGPLRNIANNYIVYQLKVTEPKNENIDIGFKYNNEDHKIKKMFNNSPLRRKYSDKKPSAGILEILLNPFEKPLNNFDSDIVKEITISYNENRISVFGIKFHYIVFFFVFSVVGGFLFKGAIGAEI